ncbi:hypothetical protein ACQKWADRAFT_285311 [Trichoderma austrokoningii]
MARFDAPDPTYEREANAQWYKTAPHDMRSPDHLWGEYWQRFNTFRIPLFDRDEYFKMAMAIAKVSKSKEDFERRFEESNKRREKELRSMLKRIFWDLEDTEPTLASYGATSEVTKLSCLEHLVRLINGFIFDRKAAIESAKIVIEKQDTTEESLLQEKGQIVIEDETETLIRGMSRSPSTDPAYEYGITQSPDESNYDWAYESNKEQRAAQERYKESETFFRTDFESLMPASDDAASHTLNSDDDTPSMQQVPSLISGGSRDLEEGNSSKSSSMNSAKKRVRFDNDEDISNVGTHEPKRRKIENTLAHADTSPISPTTRASSIQATNANASRKRSRSDEDEEDNGYKRQKIEALPRPPSPAPVVSSVEDESTNHLAQENSGKIPEEQVPESNSGGRQRRKQKPKSPSLRAKSSRNALNTRSSRRAKSSTLWELDTSGKPRRT